jgi:meiotically up-regulated gene 157 (Mug157) protein
MKHGTQADAATIGRPPLPQRCFTSRAVEAALMAVGSDIADAALASLFNHCLPNTLDTAVQFSDGPRPRCFVVTGDIPAMWLRDAAHQVWPYLRFAARDEPLRRLLAGVIHQQTDHLLADPYANAFERATGLSPWADDLTAMHPLVHERKWELDSPCAWMRLSAGYWRATGDLATFDSPWRAALRVVMQVLRTEQGSGRSSPYRFQRRTTNPLDTLPLAGAGWPSTDGPLIRSAFRPSDDACTLPFHVPSNFMAMASLRDVAPLLVALGEAAVADAVATLAEEIRSGLDALPVPWPQECDGFGSAVCFDDANLPSLLSLPWLGACSADDPRYLLTRQAVLSPRNPFYFRGTAADGIGSPHTGLGRIWPLAIIVRALTSTDDDEIRDCLAQLLRTHAGTGFMHESFDADDPARYTRPWFAWANSMFGELILQLHEQRPHLLAERFP